MRAVVGDVDAVIRADGDAVGTRREVPFAPRADECAVGLVDDDRVLAAGEGIDAVLRVDGDAGHVGVLVAAWQLLPVAGDLEAYLSTNRCHDEKPSLMPPT